VQVLGEGCIHLKILNWVKNNPHSEIGKQSYNQKKSALLNEMPFMYTNDESPGRFFEYVPYTLVEFERHTAEAAFNLAPLEHSQSKIKNCNIFLNRCLCRFRLFSLNFRFRINFWIVHCEDAVEESPDFTW